MAKTMYEKVILEILKEIDGKSKEFYPEVEYPLLNMSMSDAEKVHVEFNVGDLNVYTLELMTRKYLKIHDGVRWGGDHYNKSMKFSDNVTMSLKNKSTLDDAKEKLALKVMKNKFSNDPVAAYNYLKDYKGIDAYNQVLIYFGKTSQDKLDNYIESKKEKSKSLDS